MERHLNCPRHPAGPDLINRMFAGAERDLDKMPLMERVRDEASTPMRYVVPMEVVSIGAHKGKRV